MKLEKGNVKRCGIFLFFDKEGIVDSYIPNMLSDLKESLDYLLVVCNGYVNQEGLSQLSLYSDEVICRANMGYDVGGYREGLFYIGWRALEQYDEIVMMNYTFYGPLYPFSIMFESMEEKDVSFWGITKHHKVDPDPFHALPYGYLPEHIQSHFLVLRKDLFMNYQYRDFICNMKNPSTYLESICGYEAIFTKYFEDLGFQWGVYMDTSEYEGYSYNPLMFYAKEMVEKKKCPILKRRSFFTDYSDYLLNSCGESSAEVYDYLRKSHIYNLDLIWDNLLRLENLTSIQRVLHLNYILESYDTKFKWNRKIAVIIVVESLKRYRWYQNYLRALPLTADIYIFGTENACKQIKEECNKSKNIQVCKIDKQEFVSTLYEAVKMLRGKHYDYVGVARIMDLETIRPSSNMASWQYGDWENLFGNAAVIGNVLQTFEENPRMGLCIPPLPRYGKLLEIENDGWCGKFLEVKEYLEKQKISVNINPKQFPLAPLGGSFWIRGDLLEKMQGYLHSLDQNILLLCVPYLVQYLGAFTGIGYSDRYASIEVTNQDYMFRENNKVVFKKYGANYHTVVVDRIRSGDLRFGEDEG